MPETLHEIASRVKELREISNVSVETFAQKLHMPKSNYEEFENGNADIPTSKLCEIAQILGVSLTAILTGDTPRMNVFTITRHNKGIPIERRKEYAYQALAQNFVGKKAEPFIVTVSPRSDDDHVPLHSHAGQELDFILQGKLEITIRGNNLVLNEGDCIYFDSSHPHGMKALDNKPVKFIAVII